MNKGSATNLHQQNECRYGVDCRNVHICREIWQAYCGDDTESHGLSGASSPPEFARQGRRSSHTFFLQNTIKSGVFATPVVQVECQYHSHGAPGCEFGDILQVTLFRYSVILSFSLSFRSGANGAPLHLTNHSWTETATSIWKWRPGLTFLKEFLCIFLFYLGGSARRNVFESREESVF